MQKVCKEREDYAKHRSVMWSYLAGQQQGYQQAAKQQHDQKSFGDEKISRQQGRTQGGVENSRYGSEGTQTLMFDSGSSLDVDIS